MRPPRGSRPQPNLGPGGPFSRLDACPALQRRGMLLYLVFDACGAEVQRFGRNFFDPAPIPTATPGLPNRVISVGWSAGRVPYIGCPT